MIIGTGVDLTEISRIADTLEKQGERFVRRCFTAAEIARAEGQKAKKHRAGCYAKRWAAKEACAKALGGGIDRGIYLKDIGVVSNRQDRPEIELSGGALKLLKKMTPKGMAAKIDLSLSDEGGFAIAFVVISAMPGKKTVRKKR